MSIINKFVGIPWVKGGYSMSGADCWGLTTMVLSACFNIKIGKYLGAKYKGIELSNIMQQSLSNTSYRLTPIPVEGSICVMYPSGTNRPEHMGVSLGNGLVIHSPGGEKTGCSRIDKIETLNRFYQKIEFYSYE